MSTIALMFITPYSLTMAKIITTKKNHKKTLRKEESDGTYFLKLVLYIVLGTLWIKFQSPIVVGDFIFSGLPIGLFIGLFFAAHDHFQVDRKIEYAILIVMTIASFFLPLGIVI